jgi:predicted phage-related endonuclease
MQKWIDTDLKDISDALEDLKAVLPKLSIEDKIDLAARIGSARKSCEEIDEVVKTEVKRLRKGKVGYVVGELWKAFVNIFPQAHIDSAKLKLEYPAVYQKCLKQIQIQRVTYEAR